MKYRIRNWLYLHRRQVAVEVLTALLMIFSFVLGHDFALTRLADDMHFGRTSLRDNRLVMEIKHRRVFRGGF